MSRAIKEKIVGEYGERFRDVAEVAVVSTQGVGVQKMTALRAALRAKGIRAAQVQNRLSKRALASTPLAGIDPLLVGPSTLVWGGEGIVAIAKALTAEARTLTQLEIRGGMSDGQVLSKEDMAALSRLPSREELLGQAVGRAVGQAARVVALVLAMGGQVAAQVREIEKRASGAAPEPDQPGEAGEAPEPPAPEQASGT